jgi:hypothetical protein
LDSKAFIAIIDDDPLVRESMAKRAIEADGPLHIFETSTQSDISNSISKFEFKWRIPGSWLSSLSALCQRVEHRLAA